MAAPTLTTYTAATGQTIYGGRAASVSGPAWAQAVPLRTWTPLAGTNFRSAADAIMPAGAYIGDDPIGNIVNAYSDPTPDLSGRYIYIAGGGHAGGTCNAMLKYDSVTLATTLVIAPTPTSKYPPSYTALVSGNHGPLVYPSGAAPGYFAHDLTDPADTPWNAPMRAPVASHQYTANSMRNDGVIYHFYAGYWEANPAQGTWANVQKAYPQSTPIDIGAQLFALYPNYTNKVLGQGTASAYDPVTDQFFVSLIPGDEGLNWRGGFFVFNPTTKLITSHLSLLNIARSAMNLLVVGRYLYGFMGRDNVDCNFGWRYHIDTQVFQYVRTTGDQFTFVPSQYAETCPAAWHGGISRLMRWNYANEPNNIYTVNLTPYAGTGTEADPLLLAQTRVAISGSLPTAVIQNYRRMYYCADHGCVVFLPQADSNWIALKL